MNNLRLVYLLTGLAMLMPSIAAAQVETMAVGVEGMF